MSEDRVCVGTIAGAFGVRGEVRLKSFCSVATDIAAYGPLWTKEGGRSFTVTLTRPVAAGLGARLSGVTTKEEADSLRGTELYADRDRLPELPDDEFYHSDLIGLEARDVGGVVLGRILAVHNHGAGDLIEISREGKGGSVLLPFTLKVVPTVDLANGILIVDPPEGME